MVKIVQISAANLEAYRGVRLAALRHDPTAFSSTYEFESRMSEPEWSRRLGLWDGLRGVGYLAFDEDLACGLIGAFLDQNEPASVHVVSMWVAPCSRRSGVGKELMAQVGRWAKDRGACELRLWVTEMNEGARRFYERLGFVPTGATEPYPNDPAASQHEMMARIA